MQRYIDIEKIYEFFRSKKEAKLLNNSFVNYIVLVSELKHMSTSDVAEVKHGEWIEENRTGTNRRHIKYTTKKCSVCGYDNGRRKNKVLPELWCKNGW